MSNKFFKLSDLSISYNKNSILSNFNLEINQGEFVSILGRSGEGKTTLLRTIAGLNKADQGSFYFDNNLIFDDKKFISTENRRIVLVFQDFALFPHLNVKDNISFAMNQKDESFLQKTISLCKLDKHIDKFPYQLSGGQKQRVALARALMVEPKMILLDEPFSNLDSQLRELLSYELKNILKKKNITAILVTHYRKEALSLSDKVGILQNGKLIQYGTPTEIYEYPKTKEVAEFFSLFQITNFKKIGNKIKTPFGSFPIFNEEFIKHEDCKKVLVLLRPECFDIQQGGDAEIIDIIFNGALYQIKVLLEGMLFDIKIFSYNKMFSIGDRVEVIYHGLPHIISC